MNYIKEAIARFSILVLVLAALPGFGFADQMKFLDVNGPDPGGAPYPGDSYNGQYYVSPYYGADLTTGKSNILLFCVDFNHEVSFNQQWDATIHAVPNSQAGFNNVASSFQFGAVTNGTAGGDFLVTAPSGATVNINSWQRYQVIAHLFNNELGLLGPSLKSTDAAFSRDRAVYQYAVWEASLENNSAGAFNSSFNQIAAIDSNFKADVKTVLDEALANFGTNDLIGWDIVRPNPANIASGAQEFLTPSSVPEPSSIILLGTLVFLASTKLRRKATKVDPGQ